MARSAGQPSPVQVVVLGELPLDQRRYVEVCAAAIGGEAGFFNSFEALRRRISQASSDSAVMVLALSKELSAAIAVLTQLHRAGSAIPVVLLAGAGDAAYLPLMQELGVHHVVHRPLRGTELSDGLRAALVEGRRASPAEAPPLTDEERGVNIEQLADDLNKCVRCGAGSRQIFLHSFVEGVGRKTTPRITLRCPLRTELRLEPYAYYTHVRDVCCGAPEDCAVLRAYAAWKGQTVSAYLLAGSGQPQNRPAPAEPPRRSPPDSGSSKAASPTSKPGTSWGASLGPGAGGGRPETGARGNSSRPESRRGPGPAAPEDQP